MLYCEKCRTLSPDGLARCQNCHSGKLRPAEEGDLVLLQRADQYTADLLARRFEEAGVGHELVPAGRPSFTELYDSEAMPTDRAVLVPFGNLAQAQEVSRQVKAEVDRARESREEEQFEEMSPRKRIAVQIASTIAFLVLVMLAVFGADAFSNWLKSLFGM